MVKWLVVSTLLIPVAETAAFFLVAAIIGPLRASNRPGSRPIPTRLRRRGRIFPVGTGLDDRCGRVALRPVGRRGAIRCRKLRGHGRAETRSSIVRPGFRIGRPIAKSEPSGKAGSAWPAVLPTAFLSQPGRHVSHTGGCTSVIAARPEEHSWRAAATAARPERPLQA
jgi:hypothetical protein